MEPTPGTQAIPPALADEEAWGAIPGHPGYEASTLGGVRSVSRTIIRSNGVPQFCPGQLLAPTAEKKSGHMYVTVDRGRKRKVHQLVLEAHVGAAPEGLVGCHWNGKPDDNRLTNLRWDTQMANVADSFRHGTYWSCVITHCLRDHPLVAPNLVASFARKGMRNCLVCARARAHCWRMKRKFSLELDMQAIADAYYAELVRDHPSPSGDLAA